MSIEEERREAKRAEKREKRRETHNKEDNAFINRKGLTERKKREIEKNCNVDSILSGIDKRLREEEEIKEETDKVPYSLTKTKQGKVSSRVGLTERLLEVIDAKAVHIEDIKEYCIASDIDPEKTTVRDCLIHNIIHWALKGSAPHLKELMERVDGKVPQKLEASIGNKMSITDAMNTVDMSEEE